MSFTKITNRVIEPGTITADLLAPGVGGGPAIANVQIANSSYTVLDDTAVSLDGGYIIINGENFEPNVQVLIGNTVATSVTYVSASQVKAEVGASSAGSKIVYLVNTDTGSTAIRVNGLTYSGTPTWVTGSTLPEQDVDAVISIQLNATSDSNVIYSLASGSSLPEGLTLSANGLLSGTITGLEEDTLYNFTVEAIDEENQESPRTFTVTIVVGDEYFNQTVLLLNGDGTNGAQNNTFLDGSTNNFTITRNGNTTQGTFSPFSAEAGKWSNYFDGTGDYLSLGTPVIPASSNFTLECWFYIGSYSIQQEIFYQNSTTTSVDGRVLIFVQTDGRLTSFVGGTNRPGTLASTTSVQLNAWNHCAFVRNGNNYTLYLNGVSEANGTGTGTICTENALIGTNILQLRYITGYISNFRVVNSAIYTSNFTPPAQPLTAVSGSSLLTCQSNRFRDASTNNFAITRNGDVRVTAFSPFAPAAAYSPSVNGGSGYFDGSGDYLILPTTINSSIGALAGKQLTFEFQVNTSGIQAVTSFITGFFGNFASVAANGRYAINFIGSSTTSAQTVRFEFTTSTSTSVSFTTTATLNQNSWNHVCITINATNDSSSTIVIYINGVGQTFTNQNLSTHTTDPNLNFWIGANRSGSQNYWGYVGGFKISSGLQRTENFTPPTTPFESDANTIFLCNFTNAGILDNTGRNVLETVGDAQISTAVKKYGTGSMEFDGTGDYCVQPTSENYGYGTGNFTIEFWLYLNAVTGNKTIVSNLTSVSSTNPHLYMSTSSIRYYTANADRITGGTLSTGQWYHIALVRGSGSTKLYINGAQSGSTYTDANDYGATAPLGIGTYWVSGSPVTTNTLNGFIDDLRITKGIARYTENFTPPASAHRLK
jgi:hypothetical protein